MVAAYFSEYPDTTTDNLIAFQIELRNYIKRSRGEDDDELDTTEVQHSELGAGA